MNGASSRRWPSKYNPGALAMGRVRQRLITSVRQPFCRYRAPTMVSDPPVSRASLATALLVTALELALLFVTLSPRRFVVSGVDAPLVTEHVVLVAPAPPAAPAALRITAGHASASAGSARIGAVAPELAEAPTVTRDSAPVTGVPPLVTRAPAPGRSAAVDGNAEIGPVFAPRGFTPSSPLTRRIIDSVLDSLNANMPALIWARVPTQGERDAAYKEGVLAIRLSGRALLVPADPHLAPGIRLPSFFSRQQHRAAARARTDSVLAENMERLARLRARARQDSLSRDSLQRADSIRRAATPRRPPDARTPA